MSPEKSDSKNLLVSPRGGFLYSVLFSQFSLDYYSLLVQDSCQTQEEQYDGQCFE